MSKHTCISVNFLVLMVALHLRRRESLFAGNNTKKYSGVLGHQTHTSFQMVRDEMFFVSCCVVLVAQSRLTLCDPMDYSPPGSSVHGDSPGKNTGVGCHALFQRLFPTQGSNPGLLRCEWFLYCLSHQKNPRILEWVAYPFSRGSS